MKQATPSASERIADVVLAIVIGISLAAVIVHALAG